MASRASLAAMAAQQQQPAIPSPSVAAGTMSPRVVTGGMHLNDTKSLTSAVQELKAATSAVKELNAAAEKLDEPEKEPSLKKKSPDSAAEKELAASKKTALKRAAAEAGDASGSPKTKSAAESLAKIASEIAEIKNSPTGSAAKLDTPSKKSPTTGASLASEVARTMSVTGTGGGEAGGLAVSSQVGLRATPKPSIGAGTIQTLSLIHI